VDDLLTPIIQPAIASPLSPALFERQSSATRAIAESVGGIAKAKVTKKLPFIVPPAPVPDLDAALVLEASISSLVDRKLPGGSGSSTR
jgi:hypothetical protein